MARKKKKHIFPIIISGIVVIFSLCVAAGAIYFVVISRSLPSPDELSSRKISQSTKIYDRTGEVLLYEIHGEEKRTVVPFEEIPETVKEATLAAEDINFYNQPAFDWKAIVRALIANLREGEIVQGGSTITQQLVKNVFLSPERVITRKIKELILAIELESRYTKDEIFSFYLNQIPYGSNAYGIEAASQLYFGKSVHEVSLAEAATLASLPRGPSYYSPWGTYKGALLARKDYVLDRMVEFGFITEEEAREAKKEVLNFLPPTIGKIRAPHFSLFVKEQLINQYGEDFVLNGGLEVITTLDWNLQQLGEEVVEEGVKRNKELYESNNAALVAQDPKTGQILAMVGSRDYFDSENDGNFNVATQGLRQPGSALKPFVYLTAFQKGFSPKTMLFDVYTEFDTRNDPETSYVPGNYDGIVRGAVRMEDALAQSLNIPAVKALYLAGIPNALENLNAFGVGTLREAWRYGLSLVLGGGEVKLIDLVGAYSVLARDGMKHEQTSILKIKDGEGNILSEFHDEVNRVVEEQYPRLINEILSSSELRSPIFQSSLSYTVFPGYEVALKTGTSQDYRDAWTIGYTPYLVAGIWAGNNDNTPMVKQGSSILAAVPMWSNFFGEALKKYDSEPFTRPETPAYSPKPMMNGEYIWKPFVDGVARPQVHSILFYVDKNNPLGPVPENPQEDLQFENWELGVWEWAKENIPNFFGYNQKISLDDIAFPSQGSGPTMPVSQIGEATFNDLKPESGSFLSSPFVISTRVTSDEEIDFVELYVNRRLINKVYPDGNKYFFRYNYESPLDQQSLFELKLSTVSGYSTSTSFIVYEETD